MSLEVAAQQFPARLEFPPGALQRLQDLPPGRLRTRLESLPPQAREKALAWLQNFHFATEDLESLQADETGAIFYADEFAVEPIAQEVSAEPVTAAASVPVEPFPPGLIFHSRPGSPNVLYLNFLGDDITGTAWNSSLNRSTIPAVGFSTDSDFSTFSDSEQTAIRRIWQRVAEDYAPFDIDVTTERPASFNNRTANALITRNTDANGDLNPASTAGGVAYVNVFGANDYATYRPAWIYYNNIGNNESYIAEAVSHEVGHNLGLSHDGKTDGSDYYSGHGSGDISWGPLMGSSYGKNVTQWSQGEYYLANNTQDDLETIAAKLSYLPDDHGGAFATATPLAISEGMVTATTPETDPDNSNIQNKGIIHGADDIDLFSFAAGTGQLDLTVSPWVSPSGTAKGGNLDLVVELYNSAGELVLASNPPSQTYARLTTTVAEGIYYLVVANTSAGDPFSSSPSGFTSYGSIGQYFISGSVVPSGLVIPPSAELLVSDVTTTAVGSFDFTVTYSDASGINVGTIGTEDLLVTGPNGYSASAALLSVDLLSDGTPRVATYQLNPPGALWTVADNGLYTISMQPDQVMSVPGIPVPAQPLGTFTVAVPSLLYSASMDTNPGWILEPLWAYGAPQYLLSGPNGGYTGNNIIGYNLNGNYENRLSPIYATTPAIDCSGAAGLSLRFRRWLELRSGDTAAIQVSANGSTWTDLWTTSQSVSDNAWEEVVYPLPAAFDHVPSLQIRWSLSSGPSQSELGWHLDDVQVLGVQDTTPPTATLVVADVTATGASSHPATVTYSDDSAVLLGSLDYADLLVTGPNGYSQAPQFIGADSASDNSPLQATYAIPAPGGSWDAADDGVYEVTLFTNQVEDTFGNAAPETLLGSFSVALTLPGELAILPATAFNSIGNEGGPFSPGSLTYTLTNSGGMPLDWSAAKASSWLSLSSTGGILAPGDSTTVTASINSEANSLLPGVYDDTLAFVNETTGAGDANRSVSLTVNSAGLLSVTPDTDLAASGTEGGPFSPDSATYTLANNGGTTLDWSAGTTASWLTLSQTSGTLLPGSSASVTVSINAAANNLTPATYAAVIDFDNLTTGIGNTTRSASLMVYSHGVLEVTPSSDLAATGTEGGPFTPNTQVYTLANNGGTPLDWSATTTAPWLSLSQTTSGTLLPGTTASLTVSINAAAAALEPANYNGSISILNNTTGQGNATRTASLSINSAGFLTILDSPDLAAAGEEGGPFTPTSTVYTLTNTGGGTLLWSADVTAEWLALSSASGSLAPGETTTLTLSLHSTANNLAAGRYTATLNLINTTTGSGSTTRPASLTIQASDLLAITPAAGLEATGTEGGPFTPAQVTYTLANTGGMPLIWSAAVDHSWLNLSTDAGMLEPGEETTVTLSLNAEAGLLPPGTHHSSIQFLNNTSGHGDLSLPISLTVNSRGVLTVTSGSDLAITGTAGGPFSPDNQVYTLRNSGGSMLEWAATESADWLNLSSSTGTLAPGQSTTVTLMLNNAETLPPGEYHASVSFQDVTPVTSPSLTQSAGSTHSISLTVNAPGQLAIGPATGFHANGYPGGPFQPAEHSYTLTNEGESPLDWSISSPADWLALSATSGALLPGATTNIVVSLGELAATLSPGTNSTTLTFTDLSTGKSSAVAASLTIFELPVIRVSNAALSGEFTLETTGIPGWTYRLEASADLVEWLPLATELAGSNGPVQFADPETASHPHRFYRVAPVTSQ